MTHHLPDNPPPLPPPEYCRRCDRGTPTVRNDDEARLVPYCGTCGACKCSECVVKRGGR